NQLEQFGVDRRDVHVRVRHADDVVAQPQVRWKLVGLHIFRPTRAPQVDDLVGDDVVDTRVVEIGDDQYRACRRGLLSRQSLGGPTQSQNLPKDVGGQAQ